MGFFNNNLLLIITMEALQRNCVMSKKRRFDYLNSRICEFFNVRIRYIGIGNQNMYACYRSDTEPGNFTDFAAVCNYDNVSPSVFDHQSIDITFLLDRRRKTAVDVDTVYSDKGFCRPHVADACICDSPYQCKRFGIVYAAGRNNFDIFGYFVEGNAWIICNDFYVFCSDKRKYAHRCCSAV